MSSAQAIDGSKMAAQLDRFFAEKDKEKHNRVANDALAKQNEAVAGMDGEFLTTDAKAQMGRPLSRQEIIARLSKMNANLVFEQSRNFPEIGGIYFRDGVSNMSDLDQKNRGRRHIVGMEWTGISPEFTTKKLIYDQWGKPQMGGQVRGWRTILQRLIKERLIGLVEAERVFSISKGRESQKWYEQIH